MKNLVSLFVLALVLSVGGAAVAGTWSDKVSFRHSGGTTIKVVEPEGFKVTITLADGSEKAGTVPELFTLPDADAFVKVTITPNDGSSPWTKKIEVRSRQQTELNVSFKADPKKADAPKGAPSRSYVGRMINLGGGCGKAWERSIKADFLRADDGSAVKNVQIDSQKNVDVEVPSGKYDVRVSFWDGAAWKFFATSSHEITKDGWKLGFGCPRGQKQPTLVAQ